MMVDDLTRLMELAAAVADLKRVNWLEAEAAALPDDRYLIRQLEVLARVAAVHCRAADETPAAGVTNYGVNRDVPHWGTLELRREIGKGSYATVYLAWDPRL